MTPPAVETDLSVLPLTSIWAMVLAVSVTAGVTEEVAFRGYMQVPLERRYGLAAAVLIVGFNFWLAHLNHGWLGLTHLPFHLAVSVLLGLLAAWTGSIWPAVVLHTVADLILLPIYIFERPAPLWESLTSGPVWETGIDATFATLVLLGGLATAASIPAFRKLRSSIRLPVADSVPAEQRKITLWNSVL
jgi:hypothetical protein